MSMKVIEKNEGQKVAYSVSGNKLFFGDDEIMVNCEKKERDYDVLVDICMDRDDNLVIGVGAGMYYAAQIAIPAATYTVPENPSESSVDGTNPPVKNPFTMDNVTLTLWSLVNPTPAAENESEDE